MTRNFTVYELYSVQFDRFYKGQTNDLINRIIRHNNGLVKSTKPYRPWELVYSKNFQTRSEAMRHEKFLKTGKGREYIKELVVSTTL